MNNLTEGSESEKEKRQTGSNQLPQAAIQLSVFSKKLEDEAMRSISGKNLWKGCGENQRFRNSAIERFPHDQRRFGSK